MLKRLFKWLQELNELNQLNPEETAAHKKRRELIKSAQRKVAADGNAKRVTSDEWNALAYKPLQEAMAATALPDDVLSKLHSKK